MSGIKTQPCVRCGQMAEHANTNTAGHIKGKDIENYAICQECEDLLRTGRENDRRKFWDEGWEAV